MDISAYQGNVDFSKLVHAGKDFIFIRATRVYRVPEVDNFSVKNWYGARGVFRRQGPYYFYWPGFADEILAEAQKFLNHVDYDPAKDLPWAIDVEVGVHENLWPMSASELEYLVDGLAQLHGTKEHFIYTGAPYWGYNGGRIYTWDRTPRLPDSKLWLAAYVPAPPDPNAKLTLPSRKDGKVMWDDWTIWQWSSSALNGKDYGVETFGLDLNIAKL